MLANLVIGAIEKFFKNLVEQAINTFLTFLNGINGMAGQVLDLPVVTSAIVYTQAIAGTILVTKVAYEAWMTHILRQSGDPDADPGGLLVRSAMAAAFIGGVPWFVRWVYKIGTTIAGDIARLPGVDFESAGGPMEQLMDTVLAAQYSILFVAVGVLFALVIFIVILIQTFIRAAELAVVVVVGSFMALGLTNTESSSFSSWTKELISLSLAQAVQMYLVKVSFFTLTSFSFGGVPLLNLFLFCGFLWVTYKSPSIIKQFAYSTGMGKAAGGVAGSVGSSMLMRRMLTRGR